MRLPTDKSLSNGLAENKTTISVVRVTLSQSQIDRAQVQVDSIMQVKLRQLIHLSR